MRFLPMRKVKLRRASVDGYYEVTVPRIIESLIKRGLVKKGDYLTPVVCVETGAIVYLPEGVGLVEEKLRDAIVCRRK